MKLDIYFLNINDNRVKLLVQARPPLLLLQCCFIKSEQTSLLAKGEHLRGPSAGANGLVPVLPVKGSSHCYPQGPPAHWQGVIRHLAFGDVCYSEKVIGKI